MWSATTQFHVLGWSIEHNWQVHSESHVVLGHLGISSQNACIHGQCSWGHATWRCWRPRHFFLLTKVHVHHHHMLCAFVFHANGWVHSSYSSATTSCHFQPDVGLSLHFVVSFSFNPHLVLEPLSLLPSLMTYDDCRVTSLLNTVTGAINVSPLLFLRQPLWSYPHLAMPTYT